MGACIVVVGEIGGFQQSGKSKGSPQAAKEKPTSTTPALSVIKWKGGTKREFLDVVKEIANRIEQRTGVRLQVFRDGIANLVLASPDEFFGTFGQPDRNTPNPDLAGTPLENRARTWTYRCKDGSLTFKVQPTQDGGVLITTRP